MNNTGFRVGVVFPQLEIEPDAIAIRDFAQRVEALGYSHIVAYDHVVGADISNRPGWNMPYTHLSPFHEPLVLFAYLAGVTKTIVLMSGVIILPQRQTVLLAKQAANVDVFSGGRLALGVGAGWNKVEYEALGMPYEGRGEMLEEQVAFLRRLFTEPVLTQHSPRHDISEAGILPLPIQRPIPIWIGGVGVSAMQRAARIGDGWFPAFPAEQAEEKVAALRDAVLKVNRDPAEVPLQNIIFLGTTLGGDLRTAEDAVQDALLWQQAGAEGVAIHSMGMGFGSAAEHLALLEKIATMLRLKPVGSLASLP